MRLIIAPLLAGIVLVFSLVHKWLHNLVFSKLDMPVAKAKELTSVVLILTCVLMPIVPAVLCFMGLSVGVVTILTFGLIRAPEKHEIIVTDARVVD